MVKCLVIDETSGTQFPRHLRFAYWVRDFSRVPTIGEYVVRDGKGFKVESVIWDEDDEIQLVVAWDGWLS